LVVGLSPPRSAFTYRTLTAPPQSLPDFFCVALLCPKPPTPCPPPAHFFSPPMHWVAVFPPPIALHFFPGFGCFAFQPPSPPFSIFPPSSLRITSPYLCLLTFFLCFLGVLFRRYLLSGLYIFPPPFLFFFFFFVNSGLFVQNKRVPPHPYPPMGDT